MLQDALPQSKQAWAWAHSQRGRSLTWAVCEDGTFVQQRVAGTSGLVGLVLAAAAGGGELGHGREELGSTACRDEKTSEEAQDSLR